MLCKSADFTVAIEATKESVRKVSDEKHDEKKHIEKKIDKHDDDGSEKRVRPIAFSYNIQIHLPATTEIAVYNAIFKSLKDHLGE